MAQRRVGARMSRWLTIAALGTVLAVTGGALAPSARSAAPTPDALYAKLAVLRRPQTPADVLPLGLHIADAQGAILRSFTRLVASEPGARLFMVVTRPAGGRAPLWVPQLGDQVAIVAVTAGGATETPAVPAADLTNADAIAAVGATPRTGARYRVTIVPDGVTQVRWAFGSAPGKVSHRVNLAVADNVAVSPVRAVPGLLQGASWAGADGSVVPTSDHALRHAIAARDAVMVRDVIQGDTLHSFVAAPALLTDFAVFAVHSSSGVTTSAGLTISHPRLSQVPLPILEIATPNQPAHLDPEQIRAVRTRSGARMWIIPGARGLCVATLKPSAMPLGSVGPSAAEGCTRDLASAESRGTALSSRSPGGVSVTSGVLPRNRPTVSVLVGRHTRRTIRPPDGVYVVARDPHRP